MDSFGDESAQSLQEMAGSLDSDMLLPPSDYDESAASSSTPLDTVEEQRLGIVEPPRPTHQTRISIPMRPGLRRETSVPAPSQPPPAPPPPLEPAATFESRQLQLLSKEVPTEDPQPYAFSYTTTATLPEELEEWFSYSTPERANILRAQSCFATEWGVFNNWAFTGDDESPLDWVKTTEERRRKFMERLLDGIRGDDETRLEYLEAMVYVVLGCWHETAGLEKNGVGVLTLLEASSMLGVPTETELDLDTVATDSPVEITRDEVEDLRPEAQRIRENWVQEQYVKSGFQLQWLETNTMMLLSIHNGLKAIYDCLQMACLRECSPELASTQNAASKLELEKRETWCALTIFYVCLEIARTTPDVERRTALRSQILSLQPNLLAFLSDLINRLRWDPSITGELQSSSEKGPSSKLLVLLFKSILICLGDLPNVEAAKRHFRSEEAAKDGELNGPIITASPLDYHTFRTEITSKYPAYSPPPPLFPLDPDQRSMLPPLRVNASKPASSSIPAESTQHGESILRQPVHIATPAPSPPPSPALGKGGKKQNWQTPHGMPFNYPPLDAGSNEIGGKGSTMLQDALVGRKWEGSDIPTSILEAAELFSKRMRATRALKQLWEERVEFMKYERGWAGADEDDEDVRPESDHPSTKTPEQAFFDGSVQERLATVEKFYADVLPHLQSLVMVLMKTILSNVTSLITQAAGQAAGGGIQSGFHLQDSLANGNGDGTTDHAPHSNGVPFPPQIPMQNPSLSQDELDKQRTEEISAKAVTGILLLLLKWFKVSHVLKMEYLSQLLVDANYIPVVLKLLQTQDIERALAPRDHWYSVNGGGGGGSGSGGSEWNFFRYCRAHSRIGLPSHEDVGRLKQKKAAEGQEEPSDDEAAPPPIKRHRSPLPPPPPHPPASDLPPHPPQDGNPLTSLPPPLVDELNNQLTPFPPPLSITNYPHTVLLSQINYLRILQKLVKNKAHRNLMLITYKSANHLKKGLRIPVRDLRLATLRIVKGMVAFCGRKWRGGNMRVVTAVYLTVPPQLRDDWLSGSDIDAEVEQSVPMEQSLRALTHWYNLRRFPTQMGSRKGVLKEEQDFFQRELERCGWVVGGGVGWGEDGGEEAVVEGVEWGVGHLEGWDTEVRAVPGGEVIARAWDESGSGEDGENI